MKYSYDIRQIDALVSDIDDDDMPIWYWNSSYHIDTMETTAQDHKKAFINWLYRNNTCFSMRGLYVSYDGNIYELRHKDDDMPICAAIPNF